MLRELDSNEMKMVSGGTSDIEPPPGFTGQQWEWAWAQNDPLVMEQMMGPPGYEGSAGGNEHGGSAIISPYGGMFWVDSAGNRTPIAGTMGDYGLTPAETPTADEAQPDEDAGPPCVPTFGRNRSGAIRGALGYLACELNN